MQILTRVIHLLQVLTMAVNSGLVTYPTKYKKLGYALGLTVWEPVPPEHYISLGHLATTGEDEPSVKEVDVLHLLFTQAAGSCKITKSSPFIVHKSQM